MTQLSMSEGPVDSADLRRFASAVGGVSRSEHFTIEPLAGDVSTRRYYRVQSGAERAIVAYYPPDLRPAALRFERTTALLEAAGVRVPAIRGVDHDAGLMLLEDVGTETLFDWRDRPWNALAPYLEAAFDAALRVRGIDRSRLAQDLLAPLDAAALERELAMTWDVFLVPNRLVGDDALSRRLREWLGSLCHHLEAGGMAPCHRDLMARNLVPLAATGEVVVLDHQDLRLGPAAYDTASLFNDSLYPDEDRVQAIVGRALHGSPAYHGAVVQRAFKIVGTFASFARRGQPRHLPLIPPSLRRGLAHLAELPDAGGLAADLERRWADALC